MWLILVASIAETAIAQGNSLTERLGLPTDNYWVASNGVAVPMAQFTGSAGNVNEILILRHRPDGLEPVGWFEITEDDHPAAFASAKQILLDGNSPGVDLRLSGTWLTDDNGSILAAPDARVEMDFDDPAGVLDWHLTDGNKVASANSRWAPGEHQLTLRATDALGNEGVAGRLQFTVDNQGPSLKWQIVSEALAEGPNGTVYSPPVSVQLAALDGAGITTLEVNDGDGWRAVENNTQVDFQSTQFKARATDGLGNVSESEGHWRYDLQAPLILVSVLGQLVGEHDEIALPVGGTIDITVTDDGVGVADASYRYNRKQRRALPQTIRFVDRGWYQMQIRAVDKLGNERVRNVDVRTSPRAYRPGRAGRIFGDQP